MSGLSNMPVDNGQRLPIVTKVFIGTAGVRADERGGEFAFEGTMPLRMPEMTGTIDGRPIRIISLRKSTVVAGMVVVRFEYPDGAE